MPVLAGQDLAAKTLDQGTYVPVLTASTTNPTLGTGGSQAGWWQRVGDLIIGGATIRFGTSGIAAGSGTYFCSLPFPADTTFMVAALGAGLSSALGSACCRDNSVPNASDGNCYLADTADKVYMRTSDGLVTGVFPFTWAASDAPIDISFAYKADPNSL
jgi:hypothetical protein